jgi:two-component system chemotaxis response regulator CheY
MNALVVDDSRAMRMILSRIVGSLGFTVTEAADGDEAIGRLERGEMFDVALVDWNMPRMTGLEVVTKIRSNPAWNALRLVMVTTESEREAILQALAEGADEYVIKPFTPEALVQKLDLIGMSRPAS